MKILLLILLSSSYLFAQKYISFKEDDKWGFKNRSTGKEIIPYKYDKSLISWIDGNSSFSNHYFCVKLNGKWGIIDTNDKILMPFIYDVLYPENLYEDKFYIVRIGGNEKDEFKSAKFGFITCNKEITPIKYKTICSFVNERAKVMIDNKWGFIDTFGKEITHLKYDEVDDFSDYGLSKVKINNKFGYIDKKGEEITPLKYDSVDNFNEINARVGLKNKWGFVNSKGKEITPLKYDSVEKFIEQNACVKLNNKWGFINQFGKEIIPCKFDEVKPFIQDIAMEINGVELILLAMKLFQFLLIQLIVLVKH